MLTLLCVWANIRQKIWGWPLAIASALMYLIVFYRARLYADMALQVFFIATSLYGWYYWLFGGKQRNALPVTRTPARYWAWLAALQVCLTMLAGFLLTRYTDADLPYADATTTTASLLASWLMARKYLENWLVWIGVDVLGTGIYLYKGLWLTSLLFALLTLMAARGYRQWQEARREQKIQAA